MDLRTEPITGKNRKEVKEIYTRSFHKEERMPFWLMELMAKLRHTDFLSFYNGKTLCGFVYMATLKKLTFVMFLAVDETLRSMGYGSRILDNIQSLHPASKIIISIEPCDTPYANLDQRLRRKRFYLSNGYSETGYMMRLAGQNQEILIKNGTFDKRQFILFFLIYSNFTMFPKIWKPDN